MHEAIFPKMCMDFGDAKSEFHDYHGGSRLHKEEVSQNPQFLSQIWSIFRLPFY